MQNISVVKSSKITYEQACDLLEQADVKERLDLGSADMYKVKVNGVSGVLLINTGAHSAFMPVV